MMKSIGTDAVPIEVLLVEDSPGDVRLTKPVDLDGFLRVVKSIDNFWLSVVKLPREERS